jgi:tetratricopeptide (TPR) repeat protein
MSLFGPNIKKMRDTGDTQGLKKELKNKDPKVRIEVTKALGEFKHVTGLIEALKDDNPQVRIQAVSALADIDEIDATLALVDVLTTDSVEVVWQRAFEALDKAGIKDEKIWGSIATELLTTKRHQSAMRCFRKAVEVNPNKETLGSIGATLIEHGIYKDALEYFERFLEIDPNDARGLAGKGAALFGLDRGEEAICYCKKALAINFQLIGARNTISAIYYARGEYENLISFSRETLQFEPTNIKARVMLAEALMLSNQLKDAGEELSKALKFLYESDYLMPTDLAAIHQELGILHVMRGHREEAIAEFVETIKADQHKQWSYKLADACMMLDITGALMQGSLLERRSRLLGLAQRRQKSYFSFLHWKECWPQLEHE